ncbi:hypothetical protein C2E23DRAFT_883192 [Lenzites betulinus]|nr:hypothetical protein C2E23DRAFT_883192 [Lenzites betulinus]
MTVSTRKHKQNDPDQENLDPKRQRTFLTVGDESVSVDGGEHVGTAITSEDLPTQPVGFSSTRVQPSTMAASTPSAVPVSDEDSIPQFEAVGSAENTDATQSATACPLDDITTKDTLSTDVDSVQPGTPVTSAQLSIRPAETEYISANFINRLVPIINFVDKSANRFSLGLMPLNAEWGPTGDGKGLDKYLCRNGRPITIWMTGIATSVWLAPIEGSRVNVGVRLLTNRDVEVAHRILYGRSQPEGDASHAGVSTYASRFLNNRGETACTSFEDVYDTTDSLESWTSMMKSNHDSVKKTDIVLVECYVKRYKATRDPGTRQGWNRWGLVSSFFASRNC